MQYRSYTLVVSAWKGTFVESYKIVYASRKNLALLHMFNVIFAYKLCKVNTNCVFLNLPKNVNISKPDSSKDPSAETLDENLRTSTNARKTYQLRIR